MDFKGAFIESLFVTTGFAALGAILFWLIAGRYWGKVKAKPYQLGLWWGAWLDVFAVMAVGGNNYHKGWLELTGSLVASVPVYFVFGFIAGYVVRKMKPLAFHVGTGLADPDKAADALYEQALDELDSGKTTKATWARAMAEGTGDDAKTRAVYIRLRVSQLLGQVTEQPANPSAGNSPPSLASNSRSAAAVLGGAELDADRKFRRLQDEERGYRVHMWCAKIGVILGGVICGVILWNGDPSITPRSMWFAGYAGGGLLGGAVGWSVGLIFRWG